MILLIDNYDSFTYNLYQYVSEIGAECLVMRNDEITLDEIEEMNPEAVILSPGPGRPESAGICMDVIRTFGSRMPILGICLGHQAIAAAFGGNIIRAGRIVHGKTSVIQHTGGGLFKEADPAMTAMRYHSLVIEKETLSDLFEVDAYSADDHEIMAIRHRKNPIYGLQFHPESIGTAQGKLLLQQFINRVREELINETIS